MDKYVEKEVEVRETQKEPMQQIQIQRDERVKRENREGYVEYDKGTANIIYIFVSPDKPGIKFYSHSPNSALHFGTFETDISSISTVDWDSKVNSQGGASLFRVNQGTVTVKTYIVSVEQMLEIMYSIIKQKDNDKIIINVVEDKLKLSEGTVNLFDYNAYPESDELSNIEYKSKLNEYFDSPNAYSKAGNNELSNIEYNPKLNASFDSPSAYSKSDRNELLDLDIEYNPKLNDSFDNPNVYPKSDRNELLDIEYKSKLDDSFDSSNAYPKADINELLDIEYKSKLNDSFDSSNAYPKADSNRLSDIEYNFKSNNDMTNDMMWQKFYDYNKIPDESTDGIGGNNLKR